MASADWRTITEGIGRQYGLGSWFTSQINAESGFNPRAVSSAGAAGIAQIVPKYHPGVDPFNPLESLHYSANWMRSLVQRYSGNVAAALAAYNAGPGAVDVALRKGANWQTYLPRETQTYISRILGGGGAGGARPGGAALSPVAGPLDPALLARLRELTAKLKELQTTAGRSDLPRAGIGSVIRDLTSGAGTALTTLNTPFDWESEHIGRPLSEALITPLKPILPDNVERALVWAGSQILVPSNAAMALPVGEVIKGLRAYKAARALKVAEEAQAAGRLDALGELGRAFAETTARQTLEETATPVRQLNISTLPWQETEMGGRTVRGFSGDLMGAPLSRARTLTEEGRTAARSAAGVELPSLRYHVESLPDLGRSSLSLDIPGVYSVENNPRAALRAYRGLGQTLSQVARDVPGPITIHGVPGDSTLRGVLGQMGFHDVGPPGAMLGEPGTFRLSSQDINRAAQRFLPGLQERELLGANAPVPAGAAATGHPGMASPFIHDATQSIPWQPLGNNEELASAIVHDVQAPGATRWTADILRRGNDFQRISLGGTLGEQELGVSGYENALENLGLLTRRIAQGDPTRPVMVFIPEDLHGARDPVVRRFLGAIGASTPEGGIMGAAYEAANWTDRDIHLAARNAIDAARAHDELPLLTRRIRGTATNFVRVTVPENAEELGIRTHTYGNETGVYLSPPGARGTIAMHQVGDAAEGIRPGIPAFNVTISGSEGGAGSLADWPKMAASLKKFREANPGRFDLVNSPVGGFNEIVAKYGVDPFAGLATESERRRQLLKILFDPELSRTRNEFYSRVQQGRRQVIQEWRAALYMYGGFRPRPSSRYDLWLPAEETFRHLDEGAIILPLQELRRAQLGVITQGLEKIGVTGLQGLKAATQNPVVRGVSDYLDWESEHIGQPATRALITPLTPILPKSAQDVIVQVGGSFLTPSSIALGLVPFGRAATASSLLGRLSFDVLKGGRTLDEAATIGRLSLGSLFATSSRQLAEVRVAKRFGMEVPQLLDEMLTKPELAQSIWSENNAIKKFRKLTSGRVSFDQRQLTDDDLPFVFNFIKESISGGLPLGSTVARGKQYFMNNAWTARLLRQYELDPRLLPDSHVNFISRVFSPLKNAPVVGKALEAWTEVVQPIAMGRYDVLRRPWFAASNAGQAFNFQYRTAAQTAQFLLESAFGKDAVEGAVVDGVKLGSSVAARDWAAKPISAGVRGTLADIFNQPNLYEGLTAYQKKVMNFVQKDILDADLSEGLAMGISAGEAAFYGTPHRLTLPRYSPVKQKEFDDFLAAARNSPRYAATLKGRKYDWQKFVEIGSELTDQAIQRGFKVTGPGVETDMRNLLEWRLGAMARKKTEQYLFQVLKRVPETANLVDRPAVLLPKSAAPTVREAASAAGIPFEGIVEALDAGGAPFTEDFSKLGDQTLIKYVTSRELRAVPPSRFVSQPERELATTLDAMLKSQFRSEGIESAVGGALDTMRGFLLSADLSPLGLVQGMRSFAADPVAYFGAIGEGANWMATRHGKRLWAISNLPNIQYWTSHGLTLGNPLDLRPDMLEKIGKIGGYHTPISLIGAFNREMMDTIQVAKIRLANTMQTSMLLAKDSPDIFGLLKSLPFVGKAVKDIKPGLADATHEDIAQAVAGGLNNAIGPINFSAVNARNVASFFEKFFVLTPSWTRGSIGMITNAAHAGPQGIVARWLLMNQLAVGALLASKISMSLSGQMPSFDPRSPEFLQVKAPWGRFSLLPNMRVYRLPAQLLAGNPDDFDSLRNRFSDFFNFAEGRSGQIPRIAVDLASGEDFLGRKIDDNVQYLIKEMLPVMGQEVWETQAEGDIPKTELAQRLAIEFLGGVTVPKTPFRLARDRIEELAGVPFENVDQATIRRYYNTDPYLQMLKRRQQKYRSDRGGPINGFYQGIQESTEQMNVAMDQVIAARANKPGFESAFAQASADLLKNRADRAENLKKDLWGSAEEADSDLARRRPALHQDEVAVKYWTTRPELEACPLSDDPAACTDNAWTDFRARRLAVLAGEDQATKDYVLRDFVATRYRNPVAQATELRRVAAQEAANQFFEEPPYVLPNGQKMPKDLLQEVFNFRREFKALTIQVQRQISGPVAVDMPEGLRRTLMLRLYNQATDPKRRAAILFETLWSNDKLKPILRNRARDAILVNNPDMIKFDPKTFAPFLARAEILNRLSGDPEIAAIAAGQIQ